MSRRFGRLFPGAAILVAFYLLAACAAAPGAPPSTPFQLANTKWTLTGMTENGAAQPLASKTPTLEFQADALGGNAGCNSYSGGYKTQGEMIQVQPLQSTLMACAEADAMAQEAVYLQALQNARVFEVRDNTLKITYGDGKGQLVFQPAR